MFIDTFETRECQLAEFKTSARAVDMLGRQQIAGIPSAISELFKNAHDAYATLAQADFIRYENLFLLRDDGDGMSRSDFEERWLTLGTSSKFAPSSVSSLRPAGARAILGEKGIGRLAIAAIGPQTLIVTKAASTQRVVSLIHWGMFELAHADLSQLLIPVHELAPGDALPLEVMVEQLTETVRSLVTEDDGDLFGRIEVDLRRWADIDPVEIARGTGLDLLSFDKGTAFLITPASPDLEADLEPRGPRTAAPLMRTLIGFANTMTPGHSTPELVTAFRDHRAPDAVTDVIQEQEFFTVDEFLGADHHFRGNFDEYGQFSGTVSIFGGAPIDFPLAWTPARGVKTQCGPFSLNLAYIQGLAKHSHLEPNDYYLITEKLDRYGGLYIYRDGIRVLPYGDSTFDWLDVELRRTKSASDNFFSYRRMFGAVEISRAENGRLREKAGREGFATNEAYRQFKAILENFLLNVAADFFREGGARADIYEQGRLANERMEKARRVRSKQVRSRRSEYSQALDRFFESADSQTTEARAEDIRREVSAQVVQARSSENPAEAAERLVRAEASARARLRDLASELEVKRPRGVALSANLARRAAAYEQTRASIFETVIAPTEKEIDSIFDESETGLDAAVHRRLRFDEAIRVAVSDARTLGAEARHRLMDESARASKRSADAVQAARLALEEVGVAVLQTSATTDLSQVTDDEFVALRNALERQVRDISTKTTADLQSIFEQLRSIAWSPVSDAEQVSILDQIEQLEERVEVLTSRAEQDFELVQVGMAVNIVTHEFENSIRSVRDNLRRLRTWAQANPGLRPLYSDLRASFDHLDSYLKLFTPLHRRLYREPVTIHGSDVTRYLMDVFRQRLAANAVDLLSTTAFNDMRVRMYPSTLYPVIVNLVDNSVYWLTDFSGKREVVLDFRDGVISVTDSGRGVNLGDGDSVFEQGFSRKPAGSGYGLFVARQVLRRDGYDIRLCPQSPNNGARFEIYPGEGE